VLGETLLPPLNRVMDALTPFLEGAADFADRHPQVTAGLMGVSGAFVALHVATLAHPVPAGITALPRRAPPRRAPRDCPPRLTRKDPPFQSPFRAP